MREIKVALEPVTREVALCEGLRFIADYLERDEIYDVSQDVMIHGDAMKRQIIDFAKKLAADKLPNWAAWVARKNQA